VLAGALTAILTLTGCGPSANDPNPGGAQLAVARVKDAVGLDPAHETDGLSLNVTTEIFQGLVKFKPGTFDVAPDIARSWYSSKDGRQWTFTLKPGLKFSDGTPVDAAAVKFNFDRWRLPNNPYHGHFPYGYYASMFGGFPGLIVGVDAPAPGKVVFTLKEPLSPFLRDLAMPSFGIGSPTAIRKNPQNFGLAPVASGPYTLAEWVKDDHITLAANPAWAGPKASYGMVIVRDIPDQSTAVLSMKKADVDILVDPRPDDARDLAQQSGIRIYQQPSNNVSYLAMNMDKKPFDNVLVRRAIAYAIDKQAIANGFYALGAAVANNWTPPGMLGEDPKLKAYPQDIPKAKALLVQAGFAHGFATQLYYPTSPRPYMPEPGRIAEAIQANLKSIGIDVTLQPLEFSVFLTKGRNGEHPMLLIGWTGDNGDPDNFMYPLLDRDSAVKGQAQNYSFWRDPKFHALMLAGQQTTDERKRAQIYRQANDMIADQVPAVALVHSVVSFAAKSSIENVIPNPDSRLLFELMKPGPNT